nr:hypothetical protein [uncultured bacterium]
MIIFVEVLSRVVQKRPGSCEREQQQRRTCQIAGCRSPYAHKLEESGLRLSRKQWLAVAMAMRLELLQGLLARSSRAVRGRRSPPRRPEG